MRNKYASFEQYLHFAFRRSIRDAESYENAVSGLDCNPFTKILFDYLAHLQTNHIVFIEKMFSLVDLRAGKMADSL